MRKPHGPITVSFGRAKDVLLSAGGGPLHQIIAPGEAFALD
jgi:hypothetical protein